MDRRMFILAAITSGAALTTLEQLKSPAIANQPSLIRSKRMPITVTIQLIAKNRKVTLDVLSRALPITRTYKGCRYVNTLVQADNPNKIILIQGWDSRAEQEAYIKWRQETGALQQLVNTLSKPPLVEFWELNPA